jgi:hypothetical protein
MRVLELALAGIVLATATNIAAHAGGPGSNVRPAAEPASNLMLVWDRGGSGGRSGAISSPTAGHARHWNGQGLMPHWGPNRYYEGRGPYPGPGVPTYWVWGPSGGAFDYPFADWRGPTGGWGNP